MWGFLHYNRAPINVRRSLYINVVIQGLVLLLTSILLDGEVLFHICFVAVVGYWLAVFLIYARRGSNLRLGDRQFIQVGFFITLLLAMILATVIPAMR